MLNDNVTLGSSVIVKLWDGSTLQGTVEAIECTLASERLTVKFQDIRPWQVLAIVARDDNDAKEQLRGPKTGPQNPQNRQ